MSETKVKKPGLVCTRQHTEIYWNALLWNVLHNHYVPFRSDHIAASQLRLLITVTAVMTWHKTWTCELYWYVLGVTIDWVWFGNRIYWTLKHTAC
jgi:hypothetical protein